MTTILGQVCLIPESADNRLLIQPQLHHKNTSGLAAEGPGARSADVSASCLNLGISIISQRLNPKWSSFEPFQGH